MLYRLEDGAGFVTRQLQGHARRPHQVTNRHSAEVMRDSSTAAAIDSRLPPGPLENPDSVIGLPAFLPIVYEST